MDVGCGIRPRRRRELWDRARFAPFVLQGWTGCRSGYGDFLRLRAPWIAATGLCLDRGQRSILDALVLSAALDGWRERQVGEAPGACVDWRGLRRDGRWLRGARRCNRGRCEQEEKGGLTGLHAILLQVRSSESPNSACRSDPPRRLAVTGP